MARIKITCDEFEAKPIGGGVHGIALELSMDGGDRRDALADLLSHADAKDVIDGFGLDELLDAIGRDAAARHFGFNP
jgi:hypothetical protein